MDKLQKVPMNANGPSTVQLYQICHDYSLPELKKRVVKFLAGKPFDESWPLELTKDVYEQNRADAMIQRARIFDPLATDEPVPKPVCLTPKSVRSTPKHSTWVAAAARQALQKRYAVREPF